MADHCPRCGVDRMPGDGMRCGAYDGGDNWRAVAACRDRELANLRSLLRSVTVQLEEAVESLDDGDAQGCRRDVMKVLEALS